MPLPSKWASTKAKPKNFKRSEWQTQAFPGPTKEEESMVAPTGPDTTSQDHISYRGFGAPPPPPPPSNMFYPVHRPPSPPRESPAPSLPPRTQAIPVLYEEDTNRAQSAPLEFIASPPADGRDTSTRNRERQRPPLVQEMKAPPSSVERRRSDSHRNDTTYRSHSPAPTQRTVSVNFSASDRPLPIRPASNDSSSTSRQEKQGDTTTGKQESASILNDLMERYERKALETRQAHEKEIYMMQRDHALSLERLKQELADTKKSHSMEMRSLKEDKHAAEAKWQNMYNAMQTQREEADMARRELEKLKADQAAQLQREREDNEHRVLELEDQRVMLERKTRSHIDVLEQDLSKLSDKYERKLQEQAEKHKQTARQMQDQHEGQVAELRQKIANLEKYVQVQAQEIERTTDHERSLQQEVEGLKKQCNDLQARAAAQNEAVAKQKEAFALEVRKQHEYYEGIRAMLEERLKKHQAAHDQECAMFEERLKQHQQKFDQELQKTVARYQSLTDQLRADHRHQMEMATRELKKRVLSLESDLIDNGDDMRPSLGSGPLQARYRELKLKVETVTEPFNLAEMRSPHGFVTDQLDQSGFLVKEGKGQLRFLLRSICWSILMGGFFSSPFGFGAFGPGEGKRILLEVYATWQKLFDPNFTALIASPELSDQEDFEPFYNDKFANWWRSATFQSIQSVVLPSSSRRASQAAGGGKPAAAAAAAEAVVDERPPPQGIAKMFADNVATVKCRILDVITKVCGVDKASEVIEGEVEDMVRCASLLGVEFGAHGAKICFGMPKRGDTVQIGTEFVDCEDGDSHRGQLETVELAVTPSLFMIGDGRKDLTTASCLYPGEIYPQRQS